MTKRDFQRMEYAAEETGERTMGETKHLGYVERGLDLMARFDINGLGIVNGADARFISEMAAERFHAFLAELRQRAETAERDRDTLHGNLRRSIEERQKVEEERERAIAVCRGVVKECGETFHDPALSLAPEWKPIYFEARALVADLPETPDSSPAPAPQVEQPDQLAAEFNAQMDRIKCIGNRMLASTNEADRTSARESLANLAAMLDAIEADPEANLGTVSPATPSQPAAETPMKCPECGYVSTPDLITHKAGCINTGRRPLAWL
jgi:hypothetical protein